MSENEKPWILFVEARAKNKEGLKKYFDWLEQSHVDEVLREGAGQFQVATIFSATDEIFSAQAMVTFPHKKALDRYLQEAAPALRARGAQLMGGQVEFVRKVGEVSVDVVAESNNREDVYKELLDAVKSIMMPNMPWSSRMASLIALLKQRIPSISWVGFYEKINDELWVGPYQGKLACTNIPKGKGVCGKSWELEKAIIVPDVEKFEGHIACDDGTRSEIVVPVYKSKSLVGVLDLDSYRANNFTLLDQTYLEKLLAILEA